ncbi:beta-1,6 glucan synthetase [Microthyrium microscopicum]|uniref:Beta-1,6 glucan synthetase n=1 Tax=Microthyrium microscopicum TaxID=703497 RepID=A0A6A6U820_9PEZI|nr:beta-1,6 glucan synthetase [Microthyrium microscopicum]
MSSPPSSPPEYTAEYTPHIQSTPHIRLNSSNNNILDRPVKSRSTRSLLSASRRKISTTALGLYQQKRKSTDSNERLLPPEQKQYRDEESSPFQSPRSGASSKRSSWSSDRGIWPPSSPSNSNSAGPFVTPFDDPSEEVNTQTVAAKYNILPSTALLLYPEDIEKDDWLHNPDDEKDEIGCSVFSTRGVTNCGGLVLLLLGIMVLFIGYPVVSFIRGIIDKPKPVPICANDPMCISVGTIPLLKNQRIGLIDPDTPKSALTKKSFDGTTLNLVFSDEFNTDGRTFYDGDDAYWQAVDLWYGVTADLEWYDPDAIWTQNGTLNIRFDAFKNHDLNYRSGMLQSWNKLCFKGGRMEASISLPGAGDTIGFWPGFWSMGNLGRPGYASTTDGMWPYSYDDICDAGITANQSDPSGLSFLPGMRLPACTCKGEDHPSPGKSRGAPEIDALEASVGYLDPPSGAPIGSASQSLQTAPFDVFWRPDYDFLEIYDHSLTTMNDYLGSIYQQAISGVTNLNNKWYDGKEYQTYAFEYQPGPQGKVTWFVGNSATWTADARSMGPNGNIGQRVIPQEPMSMVINFGMSNGFAALNMEGLAKLMPATMRIDYIRIYQPDGETSITCDPPGYETTEYIARHPEAYNNANLTTWAQTPYQWPLNSLVNGCKAANFDESS